MEKRESEISATINRMGPINMAAIDQFKEYEEVSLTYPCKRMI